jgi:hypothetical protein
MHVDYGAEQTHDNVVDKQTYMGIGLMLHRNDYGFLKQHMDNWSVAGTNVAPNNTADIIKPFQAIKHVAAKNRVVAQTREKETKKGH